jgi:hypothetical protein
MTDRRFAALALTLGDALGLDRNRGIIERFLRSVAAEAIERDAVRIYSAWVDAGMEESLPALFRERARQIRERI